MAKPFKGTINVDIRDSTPDWEPYTLPKAPVVGRPLYTALHAAKSAVKDWLIPQTMFADLGLKYLGPVDGHGESFRIDFNFRGPGISDHIALADLAHVSHRHHLPAKPQPLLDPGSMRDAGDDVLAFAAADAGCFFGHAVLRSFRRARRSRRSGERATRQGWPINLISSCRRSASPCPCGCGRSYGYADRGSAGCGGGAGHGRQRDPSGA